MPNTIAQNLQRLIDAKDNIATAITDKGVVVPSGSNLGDFSELIDEIVPEPSPPTQTTFEPIIFNRLTKYRRNIDQENYYFNVYSKAIEFSYNSGNLSNIGSGNPIQTLTTYDLLRINIPTELYTLQIRSYCYIYMSHNNSKRCEYLGSIAKETDSQSVLLSFSTNSIPNQSINEIITKGMITFY